MHQLCVVSDHETCSNAVNSATKLFLNLHGAWLYLHTYSLICLCNMITSKVHCIATCE